jgi:hypothetical protein
MITRKPFSSVVSENSTFGSLDCATAAAAINSHAHNSVLIRTLFTEHL